MVPLVRVLDLSPDCRATEMGNEAVTQKKKSSELPKQDLEGSEVQKIGRPRTGTRTFFDEFKVTSNTRRIALSPRSARLSWWKGSCLSPNWTVQVPEKLGD